MIGISVWRVYSAFNAGCGGEVSVPMIGISVWRAEGLRGQVLDGPLSFSPDDRD